MHSNVFGSILYLGALTDNFVNAMKVLKYKFSLLEVLCWKNLMKKIKISKIFCRSIPYQ